MPEYTLRNVDPDLWSRFTERANREGWPTKALFVSLMDGYSRGDINPATPPPKELPQFAWLRAHYRQIAQAGDLADLDANAQWERLVNQVLQSPAAMSWQTLDEVPFDRRLEILEWLRRTSSLTTRQVFTLRAIAHIGSGRDLRHDRRVFQYEVLGLPIGQQAWVADFDGGWRILRVVDGEQGQWGQPHLSKEDALDTLARVIDAGGTITP
jgi:hypothetical protein